MAQQTEVIVKDVEKLLIDDTVDQENLPTPVRPQNSPMSRQEGQQAEQVNTGLSFEEKIALRVHPF